MIKKFEHKGLADFFYDGSIAGIQAHHAARLRLLLTKLHAAKEPADMDLPGWKLHPLKEKLKGHWAVKVSGGWRMTFTFKGEDAVLVDYMNYH